MSRIIYNDKIFLQYEYGSEKEFEQAVIKHACDIFGEKSFYFDVKKRISNDNVVTIPDGYLIDFSFSQKPRLYIIENELVTHDPFRHIGQQLLKFAISYKASGRRIKEFLLKNIMENQDLIKTINLLIENAGFRNIDAFLEDLIFEKEVMAVVIIDEITSDLENVLNQLTMKTDIIEFQTFRYKDEIIHKFTPFQQELRDITESKHPKIKVEDIDTIVVPANEDGFNETFLGENCWYQIRISSSMLDRLKYIAGYQTAPVSAVTYYAEIDKIEKYKDTNKYIVYFDEPAKKIGPIKLTKTDKGKAPQAPRYTNSKKLFKAKTLRDIF